MDKLLGVLAEFLKALTTVSPVAGVLFVITCAAAWAMRYLYLQNRQLQTEQVLQHEKFQLKLTEALAEREKSHSKVLELKDLEITTLHERNFERDQASGKVLEQLRLTIARSNQAPILYSTWKGINALCQAHQIDGQAVGLWSHLQPTNPTEAA